MHLTTLRARFESHAQHAKLNTDGSIPLLPKVIISTDKSYCASDRCIHRTNNIVDFNDQHLTRSAICEHCYIMATDYISNVWSIEELQQRVAITRNLPLYTLMSHGICGRCGSYAMYEHVLAKSCLPVCINCYEYAFGDKCRLVIMVMQRMPDVVVDIKRHIATLLHLSFMLKHNIADTQLSLIFRMKYASSYRV